MNTLVVSTKISAMHHWADAPMMRAYLRVSHRHDFQVSIRVPVEDADREREFHDLHDELDYVLTDMTKKSSAVVPGRSDRRMVIYDFGGMSCEQIGEMILEKMSHVTSVAVWEDPYHGAETHRKLLPDRRIITVCGSTKFKEETLKAIKMLEDRGCVALAVGSFMHADGLQIHADAKKEYDRLHLDKIRMSHGIFVVNLGGYIGESTQNEIKLAESLGLDIKYMVDPADPRNIREAVKKFTVRMESKLRKNDHKGGWENCDAFKLFDLLLEEKNELEDALESLDPYDIIDECADVANFAMMIADNAARMIEES